MDSQLPLVVERPLLDLVRPDLESLVDDRWNDAYGLREVLTELLFRSRTKAARLRERVAARLLELGGESFQWPSTAAPGGGGGIANVDTWPQRGLLAYMGYRVGQSAESAWRRRHVLEFVYLRPVPSVNSPAYMEEWGAPQTGHRLRKMAESIAAFSRNAKRRGDPRLHLAIEHWEEDLDYLHDEFYVGRYDFAWPSTELA